MRYNVISWGRGGGTSVCATLYTSSRIVLSVRLDSFDLSQFCLYGVYGRIFPRLALSTASS